MQLRDAVAYILPPCVGQADMRCGSGVNGRPHTAACKARKRPVYFCRRCQRADRVGGIHVGKDLLHTFPSVEKYEEIFRIFAG